MVIKVGIDMKRDMDLVRVMLLAIEESPHGFAPKIEISGYTQEQIGYHATLLKEAGLAEGIETTTMGSQSPELMITRLTWLGHDFLDNARENQTWNQAKDMIKTIGSASLQVWASVLTMIISKKLGI
jgi:hypothetical protein